eukprot:330000_1
MSHQFLLSVTGINDGLPHIYSSYYISGIIILLFSTWLLYQQRSPLNLCHFKSEQSTNRYFNGAAFFFFRGLSYIAAGIIAQFCISETIAYYIIWSLSIILHDISLLYLITFIGPICMLKGWTFCPLYTQLQYGKTPIMWLVTIIVGIISVLGVIIYDLIIFAKQAGIILESIILIYFFIYTIFDGCFSFNTSKFMKTIWLYVNYILITWVGLFSLIMFHIDNELYVKSDINLIMFYNIVNIIALCVFFGGILYENKIFNEVKEPMIVFGDSGNTTSGENINLMVSPGDVDYDSDAAPMRHLDFTSSDMISLVDE